MSDLDDLDNQFKPTVTSTFVISALLAATGGVNIPSSSVDRPPGFTYTPKRWHVGLASRFELKSQTPSTRANRRNRHK